MTDQPTPMATRARFAAIHPVIPVRDVEAAIGFYGRLGFTLAFRDPSAPHMYAGLVRDAVEIHVQWMHEEHFTHAGDRINLRFVIDDVDALHAELVASGVASLDRPPADKPWGTREFAFYDPDGNGLTFYRDR